MTFASLTFKLPKLKVTFVKKGGLCEIVICGISSRLYIQISAVKCSNIIARLSEKTFSSLDEGSNWINPTYVAKLQKGSLQRSMEMDGTTIIRQLKSHPYFTFLNSPTRHVPVVIPHSPTIKSWLTIHFLVAQKRETRR